MSEPEASESGGEARGRLRCRAGAAPGGLKGRGALGFIQSSAAALFERSENIRRSDRERAEGFHRLLSTAITPSRH